MIMLENNPSARGIAMAIRSLRSFSWAVALCAGLLINPARAALQPQAAPLAPCGAAGGALGRQGADGRFIVMMIPHHDGAIAMADLALTRAQHPEIRALAARIKASQSAENAQMRRWYRQWFGTDVPDWTVSGINGGINGGYGVGSGMGGGMGMGYGRGMWMGMPGMATSLEALKRATNFDRAFIEQMIPHHRMGVMMASHAQWNTQHPELRQLQAAMVRVQSQEIAQMAQWYRQWFGASDR